ncbi:MAG: DUF5989 family protein [Candidatus Aminicenantales bacterium]
MKKTFGRFSILRELMSFLWEKKTRWLIPLILLLILIGFLLILVQSSSIAPFIYPLL